MRPNIEVFDEGYDYAADAFARRMQQAAEAGSALNFCFLQAPEQASLRLIQSALAGYPGEDVRLTLGRIGSPAPAPGAFTALRGIRYLHMLNATSLEGVADFGGLRQVALGFTGEKGLDFAPLAGCQSLQRLAVENRLNTAQYEVVAQLAGLAVLRIHGLDMERLGCLPGLKTLEVYGLTRPEGMAAKLPGLEKLVIYRSNTLQSLNFVSDLQNLEAFWVVGPAGRIEALPNLRGLRRLQSVYLRDMKRLANVEGLRGLAGLRELRLSGNIPLEAARLGWLRKAEFPQLTSLVLELKSKTATEALQAQFFA